MDDLEERNGIPLADCRHRLNIRRSSYWLKQSPAIESEATHQTKEGEGLVRKQNR